MKSIVKKSIFLLPLLLAGCAATRTEQYLENEWARDPFSGIAATILSPIALVTDVAEGGSGEGGMGDALFGSSNGAASPYESVSAPAQVYQPPANTQTDIGTTITAPLTDMNVIAQGTWSVPSDIYLDSITHQALVPVTVSWYDKDPRAFDRLTITVRSKNATRPVIGTGFIQITSQDPPIGSKIGYMTVTGNKTTEATFSITNATLTGAFAGTGTDHSATIHGN